MPFGGGVSGVSGTSGKCSPVPITVVPDSSSEAAVVDGLDSGQRGF